MTEMWRARPQTARVRISNSVSGRQCHLIHLTILRRFPGPIVCAQRWPTTPFIPFNLLTLLSHGVSFCRFDVYFPKVTNLHPVRNRVRDL